MDYSALDDITLVRLIGRAQADALSAFYDRYSRLVFSLALNIVGNRHTAEEIALDVFMRVWEKAETYRADRAKVSTWLTSITRYRAIDELRRREVRPERHSVEWAEVSSTVIPHAVGAETTAELTLQRQRVRAAVHELPHEQRQALALAYLNGYSHREIAEALDLPLGTVKTRVRLAMQKLRELLKDEYILGE